MSAEQMTGAKIVVRALKDQGVDTVFGYPGGAALPIYDEIFQQNDIRHVLVRHEQGAIHAAEGYARSTGKVGVVLVTSGPGATNTVTGLTDALLDSIPVLVITAQVPTFLIGTDAFQEADTIGITRPCTKHNWLVKDADKLANTIAQYALYEIESGAQAIQVFDTWAGELTRADYEEFALPYTQRIFEAIGSRVPRVLYLNGTANLLECMATSGADVLSIDWRIPIGEARARLGPSIAVQGNLDPCLLLGNPELLRARASQILAEAGPRGHILNLGHGILPSTPVENARAFVESAQTYTHGA